eukprot:TRINITY_DN2808_c1_g2_i2.p1 TRINITY_DN2808_c1_g2~~TRINITY_DN2808_c1_g2_i2.p1  ORF type:complete len:300 (+),score=12.85 TRINITY_DN2808_c1_g2_i2:403-1302(+)
MEHFFMMLKLFLRCVLQIFSMFMRSSPFQVITMTGQINTKMLIYLLWTSTTPILPQMKLLMNTTSLVFDITSFQMPWKYNFSDFNGTKTDFYLEVDLIKRVDAMILEKVMLKVGDFNELGLGVVRLPFSSSLEMLIVLPQFYPVENRFGVDAFNVEQMIRSLSTEGALQSILQGEYEEKLISLQIPKFNITHVTRLGRVLEESNIRQIFIPGLADFSKMTNETGMYVQEGFHLARIQVNSQGSIYNMNTENAASNEDIFPEEYTVFKADRPFAFMLVHVSTNSVILLGIILDPTKSTCF